MKYFFFLTLLTATTAWAYDNKAEPQPSHVVPAELQDVGVKENLGGQIDMSIPFKDQNGKDVVLGDFYDGTRPVLMTIVYFGCPSLCNYHLNGLLDVFKKMTWTAGKEFRVVAISMDHSETPDLAKEKLENYLAAYGRVDGANGWHFLTGTEENIKKAANQVGFKFKWVEAQKQFSHASVSYVTTPGGQLSRYLYGIDFDPTTLRMSLLEASKGQIGSIIDQVILFCFKFDPSKNRYTLYAYNLMKVGATIMILVLATIMVPVWLRERRMRAA